MISAGIPAYNEENLIGQTIISISKYVDNVIVVDDNSSDLTYEIARRVGAITLQHRENLGYGRSVLTLLRETKNLGADVRAREAQKGL